MQLTQIDQVHPHTNNTFLAGWKLGVKTGIVQNLKYSVYCLTSQTPDLNSFREKINDLMGTHCMNRTIVHLVVQLPDPLSPQIGVCSLQD